MPQSPDRRSSPKPLPADANSAKKAPKSDIPPSPAYSNKSSDSEGKPVREKLKETRIDAQNSSDTRRPSDQRIDDAPNGTDAVPARELSTSGSENGRSRLRRKRSREDFEDEEKPVGKKHERHVRKKSSPKEIAGTTSKAKSPISHEEDRAKGVSEELGKSRAGTNGTNTPAEGAMSKDEASNTGSKRTHDQATSDEGSSSEGSPEAESLAEKTEEEPVAKRPRDEKRTKSKESSENKSKITPTSGFVNTSAASPFSALSSKAKTSTEPEKPAKDLPQTSDDKFKASGFGNFAASSTSPFGGLGGSNTRSPFAAPASTKLSSFASTATAPSSSGSGFSALTSGSKSNFGGSSTASIGGSAFGGSLGQSAFGGLGGAKTGLSSFATSGAGTITGLSKKPERPFGASGDVVSEDEDDGGESDSEQENESSEKPKNIEPVETGEENEETAWSGRAKLYTVVSIDGKKDWKERGVGSFKFNISKDSPRRARFILRADGTHRLLLNAALTNSLKFGDGKGEKPSDGKLLFNSPASDGTLEMHLLRMKPDKASELWDAVRSVKKTYL